MTSSRKSGNSSRPRRNAREGRRKEPPPPPSRQAAARQVETSAPEIRVGYGPAGRETLAAIAEELVAVVQTVQAGAPAEKPHKGQDPASQGDRRTTGFEERSAVPRVKAPKASPRPGSAPDIAFGHAAVGRETMSAIAEELVSEPTTGVRSRMSTLGFEETRKRHPAQESGPELVTEPRPAGRDTLAAIERELESKLGGSDPESGTHARSEEAALEVFEMATFVVRGPELSRLSSQQARRDFVAERLMHRLPVTTIDEVDRVDVTPWTVRGTVIVRVWCRVPDR